jgi:hypothetical protein
MKKVLIAVLAAATISAVFAQTDTQNVTFEVTAVNDISVTGAPSLTLSTLNAEGTAFEPATDATSTYSLFTNSTNMKITAALDLDMPAGLTLTLDMTAPSGAVGTGSTELSATAADLVTNISQVSAQNLGMTYTLSGTPSATAAADTRIVTFTITSAGL